MPEMFTEKNSEKQKILWNFFLQLLVLLLFNFTIQKAISLKLFIFRICACQQHTFFVMLPYVLVVDTVKVNPLVIRDKWLFNYTIWGFGP